MATASSPTRCTRYTEVYRGGNALRFGGALLGGAINMVTPTGRTRASRTWSASRADRSACPRAHVELARQFGDWDVFVAATNQRRGLALAEPAEHPVRLSLNVGHGFGEDREVRLYRQRLEHQPGDPGVLTLVPVPGRPDQPPPANLANDQGRNSAACALSLQHHLAPERHPCSRARSTPPGRTWTTRSSRSSTRRAATTAPSDGSTGTASWRVAGRPFAGAWYRVGDLDSHFYVNHARLARRADLLLAPERQGRGRLRRGPPVRHRTPGPGGRRNLRNRQPRLQSFAAGPAASTSISEAATTTGSPRASACCPRPTAGIQLFANLTRSVEPPNFSSMSPTNTGFAPVGPEGLDRRVGARGRRGPLYLGRDALPRRARRTSCCNTRSTRPIPAIDLQRRPDRAPGIEAALDWRIAPRWRLRQTYTWSDFRFDGDASTATTACRSCPEHLLSRRVPYEHPAGWFVAPSVEWSAERRAGRLQEQPRPRPTPSPQRRLAGHPRQGRCSSTRGT
jgi:iron complex outermembrane receptor protein